MNYVSRMSFSPLLPFIEDAYGIGHARASSIFFFLSLGYGISVLCAGFLAGFLGERKCIFVSLLSMAAGLIAIPFIGVFNWLCASAFMVGAGSGVYLPSMIPMLTEYYDKKVWGKVISIHDSGAPIALFATPFLAIGLISVFPWQETFFLFGVILLACAVVFHCITREDVITRRKKRMDFSIWKRKTLWLLTPACITLSGACIGLYFVTPLYLVKELQIPADNANVIFGISRIGGAIVGISSGFLVDRFKPKKMMVVLGLLTGIFTICIGFRHTAWLKTFLFLQGSTAIGFFPVLFVAVSRLFDMETRGHAMAFVMTLATTFGSGLIPYLLGLSGDHISFRFGIVMLGGITCISCTPLLFLRDLTKEKSVSTEMSQFGGE